MLTYLLLECLNSIIVLVHVVAREVAALLAQQHAAAVNFGVALGRCRRWFAALSRVIIETRITTLAYKFKLRFYLCS